MNTPKHSVQTISPVDGRLFVKRAFATNQTIELALQAARQAQPDWQSLSISSRVAAIRKGIDYLVSRRSELSEQLAWQIGRPIAQCPAEFAGVQARSDYMLGVVEEVLATIATVNTAKQRCEIRREPVGLVAAITPWNYPYLTAINTIVPALAAGNCVILKPSPQAPLVGEHFAAAFQAAGLPDGVFNCLHVNPVDIPELIGRGQVDHVAFTGSNANGVQVEKIIAGEFTSVGLELGGKDAAYVRSDADMATAVDGLVDGSFYNSGQSCCAVERIYVHEKVFEEFLDGFVSKARSYTLGNPLNCDTDLGPVVSIEAAKRIQSQVEQAVKAGARKHIVDGEFDAALPNTAYLGPQVLTRVDHTMAIMRDETFGPVVGISPVKNDAEALHRINDSRFGLTASLWSRDEEAALKMIEKIDAGTVFLNRCDSLEPSLAWSGVKQSGRGCTLSTLGFDALTRPKSVNFNRCA